MTSPESSRPSAKSPIIKDSPTFGDIIGLSPIKPNNFQLISQEYESDVPSPQMVFKTPNFHCPKFSSLSERSQETGLNSSGYYSPGYANNARTFLKITDKMDGKLVSYGSKDYIGNNSSPNQSCASPSDCVDTFISDPLENCDSSFISPEFSVKRDSTNTDNKPQTVDDDIVQEQNYSSTIYVKEQTNDNIEGSNSIFLHRLPSKCDAYQARTSLNEQSRNKEVTNLSFGAPNNKAEEDLAITSATGQTPKTDKELTNEQLKAYTIIQNRNDSLIQHAGDSFVHKVKDHKISDCKNKDSASLELQLHQSYPQSDCIIINTAPLSSSETPIDPEEGAQSQRGKRKRLKFEAEESLVKDRMNTSPYMTETSVNDSSIAMIQNFQSESMDAKLRFSADVDQSEPNKDCTDRAPRPAGIGLHLNSLGKQLLEKNTNSQEGSVKYSMTNFTDHSLVPCKMKSTPPEVAAKSEKPTHISTNKKSRKKASESEGQKRCNCKKSKCLKLYCDCFGAGSYCSEACQCEGCANKAEFAGAVLETREQIKSRNPLAFLPKVIVRVTDPMKSAGDNTSITPTSIRHKQGCNCKKSQCLKKYCECFQSGVGCSYGCRCEGCKNSFGTKDGYEISEMVIEHKRLIEKGVERDLSIELAGIEVKHETTNPMQSHARFSPATPASRSVIENDIPIPQLSLCYSSECATPTLKVYQHSDTKSIAPPYSIPHNHDVEFQPVKETTFEYSSPTWDNISLSPFLKMEGPSSSSSIACKNPAESKSLQIRLLQEHGRIAYDHVSWRSSPMTPTHKPCERRFMPDPGSEMTLKYNPEDETPEILKETHEPIKFVNGGSPNQKRVSPPHLNSTHTKSPSSSRGVRKFVLQSVPPFPKLSPYSKTNRDNAT